MKPSGLVSLLTLAAALAAASPAAGPETWVPARWDGGPLEVAHRAKDKALADAAVRDAIAGWYDVATLTLLDGTPFNCLLVTFAGGEDREVEKKQQQLVSAYAAKARERNLAVLGLVYPGAEAAAVASAAARAKLDGLVFQGEFSAATLEQIEKALRAAGSQALVIRLAASAGSLRTAAAPVAAVEGTAPGVGKAESASTASASAGLWVDSNLWLVRSFRLAAAPRVVWVGHRPAAGALPGVHLRAVADAAAAGGRWIAVPEDTLRPKLLRKDAEAVALWQKTGKYMTFFAEHAEWRNWLPFGVVGIIFDTAGANMDNSEEFLNLIGRRQVPYRVIDRARLTAQALEGLRAVLAFDVVSPSAAERKILRDFAAKGGLVLSGPAWGGAPKDRFYTVASVEDGEVAVYKDEAPDAQTVSRDLNDLMTSDDFGVNVFNAPSVLTYVTAAPGGGMLIQMVNYADAPAESISIWIMQKFKGAKLFTPDRGPIDVPVKSSGARTEIAVPPIPVYGALLLE